MSRLPRWRAQFGLAELLLIITVTATWTAVLVNRQRAENLRGRIASMQQAAGELILSNPRELHAIARTVIRYPDEEWEVFLPEGNRYQLQLATREIGETGFPNSGVQSVSVPPGVHRIYLRQQEDGGAPKFRVLLDEVPVLEAVESQDWNPARGASSVGIGKTQEARPVHQPLVLKRQRVHEKTPDGSSQRSTDPVSNGLLLWVTSS